MLSGLAIGRRRAVRATIYAFLGGFEHLGVSVPEIDRDLLEEFLGKFQSLLPHVSGRRGIVAPTWTVMNEDSESGLAVLFIIHREQNEVVPHLV